MSLYTFATINGRVQDFNPQPIEDWDNVHTSTKQNGTAVFADTEEELREKYDDYLGLLLDAWVDQDQA